MIYNALTWDGCFGGAASDKSLTKKACDKMLIAEHCCDDIDKRFPEKDTPFKKKYFEYYVRMYIDGIASLNLIKDKECRKQVEDAALKHKRVFDYMKRCESGNLKKLSLVKRILGMRVAEKLVLTRYS